jgi:streptogramin lyase
MFCAGMLSVAQLESAKAQCPQLQIAHLGMLLTAAEHAAMQTTLKQSSQMRLPLRLPLHTLSAECMAELGGMCVKPVDALGLGRYEEESGVLDLLAAEDRLSLRGLVQLAEGSGYDDVRKVFLLSSKFLQTAEESGVAVSTVAGVPGSLGHADGKGAEAKFNNPYDIACAADGSMWVADYSNHCIRRIDQDGTVSTVAGVPGLAGHADGKGAEVKFNEPVGISCAADGSMWVVDRGNHCIRRIDQDSTVSTVAGVPSSSGHADGTGAEAKFNKPRGISCAADGSMWVAEYGNHCIRRIDQDGTVSTVAGVPRSRGHADGKSAEAKFTFPYSISCAADGSMWVADSNNHCIRRIDQDGTVSTVAGVPGSSGHVDGKGAEAKFNFPTSISCAADGSMWVAEDCNDCIRRIDQDSTVSTVAGVPGSAGHADGKGAEAKFNKPTGISCAADGSMWVADLSNHCIRQITPSYAVGELQTWMLLLHDMQHVLTSPAGSLLSSSSVAVLHAN